MIYLNNKKVGVSSVSADHSSEIGLIDGSITTYTIPDGTTSIRSYAFYRYNYDTQKSLTSITIPNTVTTIGNHAFESCYVVNVEIPDSVTSMGSQPFYGSGVENVVIGNSITSLPYGCFQYCNRLSNLVIGNSVTTIPSSCFQYCYKLVTLNIPDSVTSLINYSVQNCTVLTTVNFGNTRVTIPTCGGTSVFYGCSALTSIVVPDSLVDDWKAATNWTTYSDRIISYSDWQASQNS